MLLRVCLILAVVAGLAVTGVTWFMVRPQVQQIVTDRDFNKSKWTEFEQKYNTEHSALVKTREALATTEHDLEVAKSELSATKALAEQQQQRADSLQTRLNQTTAERNSAQQELAKWEALGIPVEGVRGLVDAERTLRAAVEALEQEKQILNTVIARQEERIKSLLDPERPIVMDAKLRGRIMAVDPKWEFVVLNIGQKDNLKPNGVLMVVRDGQLVANVKVSDVRDNTAIANIMPGWKLGAVMEGDTVVPYHVVE